MPVGRWFAVILIALAVGQAFWAGPAEAQTAKPRSSSANGIEVRPEALAPAMAGSPAAPSVVPSSSSVTPAGGGVAAEVPARGPSSAVEGDGGVSISGNTSTNSNLSGGNETAVGQGNSGCTNVGSISGQKCR
jgi:hypothetical protein